MADDEHTFHSGGYIPPDPAGVRLDRCEPAVRMDRAVIELVLDPTARPDHPTPPGSETIVPEPRPR